MRRRIGPLVLLGILSSAVLHRMAVGDIAPLSAEQLQSQSSDIVVGVVTSRQITRDETDKDWDKRSFVYEIEVEAVEKGDFARGESLVASAWAQRWVGSGIPPPSGMGHTPLPLEGERARFFLKAKAKAKAGEGETLEILLPNGVELATEANPDNPVRIGEPAPPEPVLEIEEEPEPKPTGDPFGWDIMLVILGIPLLIGGIRQQSKSRWGLLVAAGVLFSAAVIIAVW